MRQAVLVQVQLTAVTLVVLIVPLTSAFIKYDEFILIKKRKAKDQRTPKNRNIYVITSVGKILVVLNKRGKLLYAELLDSKDFPQPEGIAFAPDGRLFLASEGRGGKGRLMVFTPN